MHFLLIKSLVWRDILQRYKGSLLGTLWSFITPLFNLAIYTLVFGTIFRAKWPGMSEGSSTIQFALILFAGLSIHQFISEVILKAPTLVIYNINYVKKVVFPLQILVPVSIGSALFNLVISLVLILMLLPIGFGAIPVTVVALPLILIPLCIMALGLGWFLASLGVYVRDINQIMTPISTAMLFLAPIFFPPSALPDWISSWVKLNPITIPVEQTHNILVYGKWPDFVDMGIYTLISVIIAVLGYFWFQKTSKGFADVL